jgi:hypothetical protein
VNGFRADAATLGFAISFGDFGKGVFVQLFLRSLSHGSHDAMGRNK